MLGVELVAKEVNAMKRKINSIRLRNDIRKHLNIPNDVDVLVIASAERIVVIMMKKNTGTVIIDATPEGEWRAYSDLLEKVIAKVKQFGGYFYYTFCAPLRASTSPLGTETASEE